MDHVGGNHQPNFLSLTSIIPKMSTISSSQCFCYAKANASANEHTPMPHFLKASL